jgi:hypothetical protein
MYKRSRLSSCAPPLAVCAVLLAAGVPASAEPINLMWDSSQGTVTGYLVHVGTQSGNYTQRYDVGNTTAFTFPDAVAGQRYCFAVAAYADSQQSPLSSEVCGYSDAPPALANPGNQSSVVGAPVSLQLAGSDPYGQPVSYSATGLPPGITLQNSTGFISGAGTTAGTYAVSARVFDGRLSSTQAFTWTMSPAPVSPVSISIAAPTSSSAYSTTSPAVTLQGSSGGGSGISEVRWSNDRGGMGFASGTTAWSAASIALQTGSNVLTVTARDSEGREASDVLTVTYSVLQSQVTLTARYYTQRGKKYVALTWTGCAWRLVDVIRDSLPLATTENDGAYTDQIKKNGNFTYRVCETGNRANCSNSVALIY